MPVLPFRAINRLPGPTARVNQQHRTLAIRSGSSEPCPVVGLRWRNERAQSGATKEWLVGGDNGNWMGLLVIGPDRLRAATDGAPAAYWSWPGQRLLSPRGRRDVGW
jgi:hypothetical protein